MTKRSGWLTTHHSELRKTGRATETTQLECRAGIL
jgi:hypothetical protein